MIAHTGYYFFLFQLHMTGNSSYHASHHAISFLAFENAHAKPFIVSTNWTYSCCNLKPHPHGYCVDNGVGDVHTAFVLSWIPKLVWRTVTRGANCTITPWKFTVIYGEFNKSKSWRYDIRYGWDLCWCKILNTDSWLIPLFFSICLLLACEFSAAKAKIAAALLLLTVGRRLTCVCFTVPTRKKGSVNRLKAMCDFFPYPDNQPHTNLGRFCNDYDIPQHHQHIKIFLKVVHFRVPMHTH